MEPLRGEPVPDPHVPAFTYTPDPKTANPHSPGQNTPSFQQILFRSPYASAVETPPNEPKSISLQRGWKWKLRNFASTFWLWEAGASSISLILIGVICWQLMKLDDKPLSYWSYKWSPTSSLALAVTIAKASMMIPVASALGQLKWHWFGRSRRLDGMEYFDEASRGVIGSLVLLWRLKLWRLASIGALITIGALSIDALTQNAVRFTSVPNHTYGSYIFRTSAFNVRSIFSQRGRELPPSHILAAAYYAITTTTPPTFDTNLVSCESGNCTFGSYDSLAIDYECVKSEILQKGPIIQHPGLVDSGFFMNTSYSIIRANTTSVSPSPGVFKNLGPLISRWLVLANPSSVHPAPMAMDCAFYWAVKKYSSEVINGVFHEKVEATYTNTTDKAIVNENIYITPGECWRNNISYPTSNPNCTNVVNSVSQSSLRSWFSLWDFSLVGWGLNDTLTTDKQLWWGYSSIFMQAIMSNLTNRNEAAIFSQVNLTAARLSKTLSEMVRQSPEIIYTNGSAIYGWTNGTTIWQPTTLYNIHWRYLAFPLMLVGSSTLFFIATVVFTWGEGGWKSSQLAVVFHSLSENDAKAIGDVKDYANMREIGQNMNVQLVGTDTGKKLVSTDPQHVLMRMG